MEGTNKKGREWLDDFSRGLGNMARNKYVHENKTKFQTNSFAVLFLAVECAG